MERTSWFTEARFGLFIHWGVYAGPGRGEWVMSDEKISREEYRRWAQSFNPQGFNADEWADIAVKSGAKYVVFTTKHHDGYCLFNSAVSDFGSVCGTPKRDFVRELTEALRRRGIRIGFYFSLIDWMHKDFPVIGDPFHPLRGSVEEESCDTDHFRKFLKAQVRELLTQYGKIDIIWYDFSYPAKGSDFWDGEGIVRLTRELQPDILINSRLEASGMDFASSLDENPASTAGDFLNPEMVIPPQGIRNATGRDVVWEACFTMDNHWGYVPADKERKDAPQLIRKLVECVSKGGNLILNISPDAEGRIPEWQKANLLEMGAWLKTHGNSIYGCGRSGLDKPEWGRYTEGHGRLYAHLLEEPVGPIALPGLEGRIKRAVRLSDGFELIICRPWSTHAFKGFAFLNWMRPDYFTYRMSDSCDTVIELEWGS